MICWGVVACWCLAGAGGRRHRGGAAGVGGCARLPSLAAGMRSVSSTRLRCARTLWAVSGNPSGIPGSTMGLATGTSARLRAGHDVCRAPGSAARWGRAGRKLADACGRCALLRGRDHSRTRLHQGHSTYPPSANGSVDRSAASSQRRVHPQNAYRVFPRDPACAGGAPRATARALTENAACACGVRSIGRVDTTGCASGAGPTTAGAAAGRERMG